MTKATAAILIKEGRVLIAKKSPDDKRANKWEFPGGKVNGRESPEQCIVREIFEEFQINIKIDGFYTNSIFTYDEGQLLIFAYFCSYISGEFTMVEHADYKWILPKELINFVIVDSDKEIADKLIKEYPDGFTGNHSILIT